MKDQNQQPIYGYVVNVSPLKISKTKRTYFRSSLFYNKSNMSDKNATRGRPEIEYDIGNASSLC